MNRVTAYNPGDENRLTLCAEQHCDFSQASMEDSVRLLATQGSALTLAKPDGTVLMIAGIAQVDQGYGHCWAFMSAEAGPHMRFLTRKVRDYLNWKGPSHRRFEMMVRDDFPQAQRWARMLGFAHEGVMHCAARDGTHMHRYAKWQDLPAVFGQAA